MKKFYKSTKIRFLLLTLILPVLGFAGQAGVKVEALRGSAFAVSDGETKLLRVGDRLSDLSEIATQEGGEISFSDLEGHRFHLAGSGQLKLLNKIVELRQGYLWIQSVAPTEGFLIQTANTQVTYSKGEAVVSFDQLAGKSQIMVIKGEFDIANILQLDMRYTVTDGQFSFVANDYEHGLPRQPTAVGQSSFEKVSSLFSNVKELEKSSIPSEAAPSRGLASVKEGVTPGKIIVIKRDEKKESEIRDLRLKVAYGEKVEKLYKERPKKKKFVPDYVTKSNVALKIFGQKKAARGVASVEEKPAPVQEAPSLEKLKKEMNSSNEADGLLSDLKKVH